MLCFACLREAASAKAGHAGMDDESITKDYLPFVQNCPLLSKFFINYLHFFYLNPLTRISTSYRNKPKIPLKTAS
jgi:hypothetical protein